MPGGRLTHADRQRIADGLSAGLGYAEIARRLGRPTSTVSREVARNTGPHGYRADLAVRATHHRARRRKPVPRAPTTTPSAEIAAFEDHFVEIIVDTGLPRMAARVLTRLYVTDSGALTAAELAHALAVSPASVSQAVGYLESLDLIIRERENRRERYVVDEDFLRTAWTASARKNANWAEIARHGVEILGADTRAGARMRRLGEFFEYVYQNMVGTSDVLTVFAAVVHLGLPEGLAAALGWPPERLARAVGDVAGLLTPEQRTALQS
ncbi:helix-turn-helix domain-containing protein [Kibdelosporangium lantanae]